MTNSFKKILSWTSIILFFGIIVSYGLWRTAALREGVKLEVENIENGAIYEENTLTVAGYAKNARKLTLDGREIYIDKDGRFSETLILLPGYNIMSLYAEDKFGKKTQKDYELILKEKI